VNRMTRLPYRARQHGRAVGPADALWVLQTQACRGRISRSWRPDAAAGFIISLGSCEAQAARARKGVMGENEAAPLPFLQRPVSVRIARPRRGVRLASTTCHFSHRVFQTFR